MEYINGFIGALSALIVALTALIPVLRSLWRRDDRTDKRVDLMWEEHMRRGQVALDYPKPKLGPEAVMDLRERLRRAYIPLAPALKKMRKDMPNLTPGQFGEAVTARYGNWIGQHICAVIGVSDYECIVMAKEIAEEPDPEPAKS